MADPAEETDANPQDTCSEADALKDVLAWSKDCPAWQRDALRRLCIKGELGDSDLDELTALCKGNGKDSVTLAAEHIPDPKSAATAVNLRAIYDVTNVNALKEGERMTFDKQGLTVVYGDNGSGKSGYARILKKVCRARMPPKDDMILPNIYATKRGPQKAVIEFSADGHNMTYGWAADQAGDARLSLISVFDCNSANIYVDDANDVAYTPFPMRVLEQLAKVCQQVKKRINEEICNLDYRTSKAISDPECHDGTSVGKLIAGLGGKTREQDVRGLAALDDNDKARLDELKTDLETDPVEGARRLEAQKNRLDAVTTAFEALQNAVRDEQVSCLTALHQAFQTAQTAAAAAADDIFADDPLPHIGSEVWRALWEEARRYSEQHSYPNTRFPFIGDAARCVLCQQELNAEAADRLNRFEGFVRDETKRKEEEAAAAYRTALDALATADIPAADLPAAVALIRDELNDNELAKSVRRAVVTLKWRLRRILREHKRGEDAVYSVADAWPARAVTALSTTLSTRITAMRAKDESEERKKMRAEFEELADRARLAVIQDDVIDEIGRRKKRAALKAVLNDTATNRITTKSGEIAERLVTNALREQFSKEIYKSRIPGMAIELRKEKPHHGVPYFRVSLMQRPDVRVGEILSEGEHRCVALAAFLAEIATTESRSAIVFDDPTSSFDHMRREAVADRLAEEGRHRQTIVFTHDIVFLFLLDQACHEKGTHAAFRCVTRNDDHAGFVQQDPPAHAQPVEKVIRGMQKQFDKEKCFYENSNLDEWEKTVDSMQKRLRWTWERAVEEAVGPVIKRLSNKVETRGLAKVTTLTMDDCTRMRKAYGRCSTLLHSTADAMNPPLPNPKAVQNEITTLRKWVEDIKQRQSEIGLL